MYETGCPADLENLEMSGTFDARRNCQGKSVNSLKSTKSRGKSGNFVV